MGQQVEIWPGNQIDKNVRVINAQDDKFDIFVAAYCENGRNATKAAIKAGYAKESAYSQGSRLLARPEIARAIAERTRGLVESLDYSAERTLHEVARIAFVNPLRYVGTDGRPKRFVDLDEDSARALASVELDDEGRLKKWKLFPKNTSHDQLMRVHSLYKDTVKLDVTSSLSDEELDARLAATLATGKAGVAGVAGGETAPGEAA